MHTYTYLHESLFLLSMTSIMKFMYKNVLLNQFKITVIIVFM